FFSSRRRHTRSKRDWSSDVCSSDLALIMAATPVAHEIDDDVLIERPAVFVRQLRHPDACFGVVAVDVEHRSVDHLGDIAAIGRRARGCRRRGEADLIDRKSTRLNSSHVSISYAVFCLKKK